MKQKHWIFLKYSPTLSGVTLNVAWPTIGVVRQVLGLEEHQRLLAEMHGDAALHRNEAPWHARGDVGVERHSDGAGRLGGGVGGGALGVAAGAGDLAEQAVQRDGVGHRGGHHADREAEAGYGRELAKPAGTGGIGGHGLTYTSPALRAGEVAAQRRARVIGSARGVATQRADPIALTLAASRLDLSRSRGRGFHPASQR